MSIRTIVSVAVLALVVGCSSESRQENSEDTTGTSAEALQGGCRLLCPKCHPGEVCPMLACAYECAPPPARCVETMLCPIGYAWSSGACSCIPSR